MSYENRGYGFTHYTWSYHRDTIHGNFQSYGRNAESKMDKLVAYTPGTILAFRPLRHRKVFYWRVDWHPLDRCRSLLDCRRARFIGVYYPNFGVADSCRCWGSHIVVFILSICSSVICYRYRRKPGCSACTAMGKMAFSVVAWQLTISDAVRELRGAPSNWIFHRQ